MSMSSPITQLIQIVADLRGPNGCPWDKEQTWQSLRPYIIEEAYELKEAMTSENAEMLREELGDVLLHVVMLSAMADEKGWFNFEDVSRSVAEKMIRRHPHVFGEGVATTTDAVLHNWDTIKKSEKKEKRGFGDDIPAGLPALMYAQKLQGKAAKLGFDFPDLSGALVKLQEELSEMQVALAQNNGESLFEELGDLLFSVVNVCRKARLEAELSLEQANTKFSHRVKAMLAIVEEEGLDSSALDLDAWDALWDRVKHQKGR